MCIKYSQNTFAMLLFIGSMACSSYGFASTLVIDRFSDAQSVTDRGSSPGSTTSIMGELAGTDLTNVSRSFTSLATDGRSTYKEDIVSGYDEDSGKYLLKISNGPHSAGTASILWNFDAIDFSKHGNAILLDVVSIDQNVQVEMLVNGNSRSGVRVFNGSGAFLVNFSDFTDSSAFEHAYNFSLNFTGPEAWDGKFNIMTTYSTPVPLPPSFALMGSALLGIMGFVHRGNKPDFGRS